MFNLGVFFERENANTIHNTMKMTKTMFEKSEIDLSRLVQQIHPLLKKVLQVFQPNFGNHALHVPS